MKILILLSSILSTASLFAASPAATQQWVRNYVSTNTTAGGVTQKWVVDYIRTGLVNTVSAEITDAERADNALTLAIYAADRSNLHALTFTHTFTNGLRSVKMADAPSGNGWTNVVYGCGVSTSAAHVATLTLSATNYVCSVFSNFAQRNVFRYASGAITNDIETWYSSVTTNDWKKARGEN